jgi:hypothetical protein
MALGMTLVAAGRQKNVVLAHRCTRGSDLLLANVTETTEPSAFAVSDLLLKLFSVEECRHFLMKHYPDLLHEVPGEGAPPRQFFDHVAMALIRRGALGWRFLNYLQEERPEQIGEINILRHSLRLSNTVVGGPPQVGFHFRGKLQDLSVEMLTQVIALLRLQTGDASLVAVDVRVGSVRLLVGAQRDTCDRLLSLRDDEFLRLHKRIQEKTGLELLGVSTVGWLFKSRVDSHRGSFALGDLFASLFHSPEELRRFIYMHLEEVQSLFARLPSGRVSREEFAKEVVHQLERRGMVGKVFEPLLRAFPGRTHDIRRIQDEFDEFGE